MQIQHFLAEELAQKMSNLLFIFLEFLSISEVSPLKESYAKPSSFNNEGA